jgi:hypothetical protein
MSRKTSAEDKKKVRQLYLTTNKEKIAAQSHAYLIKTSRRKWASSTICNHRRKKYSVNINLDELTELADTTETCSLCGCKLNWSLGSKDRRSKDNSPSLDRIDNSNIINNNNIQIICHQCNTTKGKRTMEEFINYCKKISMKQVK